MLAFLGAWARCSPLLGPAHFQLGDGDQGHHSGSQLGQPASEPAMRMDAGKWSLQQTGTAVAAAAQAPYQEPAPQENQTHQGQTPFHWQGKANALTRPPDRQPGDGPAPTTAPVRSGNPEGREYFEERNSVPTVTEEDGDNGTNGTNRTNSTDRCTPLLYPGASELEVMEGAQCDLAFTPAQCSLYKLVMRAIKLEEQCLHVAAQYESDVRRANENSSATEADCVELNKRYRLGVRNKCCTGIWSAGCAFTAVKGSRSASSSVCRQFRPPAKGPNVACHYSYARYDPSEGAFTGDETVQNRASTNFQQCTKWENVHHLTTIVNSRAVQVRDQAGGDSSEDGGKPGKWGRHAYGYGGHDHGGDGDEDDGDDDEKENDKAGIDKTSANRQSRGTHRHRHTSVKAHRGVRSAWFQHHTRPKHRVIRRVFVKRKPGARRKMHKTVLAHAPQRREPHMRHKIAQLPSREVEQASSKLTTLGSPAGYETEAGDHGTGEFLQLETTISVTTKAKKTVECSYCDTDINRRSLVPGQDDNGCSSGASRACRTTKTLRCESLCFLIGSRGRALRGEQRWGQAFDASYCPAGKVMKEATPPAWVGKDITSKITAHDIMYTKKDDPVGEPVTLVVSKSPHSESTLSPVCVRRT